MTKSNIDPWNLPLCDILMDGGLTSGVICPKAAVILSKQFRIKNIGGTSAGRMCTITCSATLQRVNPTPGG